MSPDFYTQKPKADREHDTSDEIANLSTEQARSLADVFGRKILELSRKKELSREEVRFLDRSADLSARNIAYLYDRGIAGLSAETATELVRRAGGLTGVCFKSVPEAMAGVTGASGVSIATNTSNRPRIEDFAMTAVNAFGELVESNGSQMTLDRYMLENLGSMIAYYERASAEGSIDKFTQR